MPISPNTNPARYADEGFCLFRDVLPKSEIAVARVELNTMLANLPERQVVYKDGENKEVDARPEYLTEPHPKHPFWLELCRHPRVLDAVEQVIGPNLILIMSHLIVKRAEDGLPVAWHQDNTYWHSVQGTDVSTVWLAIDDVAEENAPMQLIPGSHQGYRQLETAKAGEKEWLSKKVEITPQQEASAVSMTMSAGSLSIHDSHLIHGGGINHSDRRRAGYTIRFCSI